MKYVLLSILVLSSITYGAVLHDQDLHGESDIYVFNTGTGTGSAVSFPLSENRWVAADYEPPSGDTASFRGFSTHYCYYNNASALGDMYFEVYEDTVNSSPIAYVNVDYEDITETDTGWDSPTSGSDVFHGEMMFDSSEWVDMTGGTTYWIAVQMDAGDNVFMFAVSHDYWDEGYWFDGSQWLSVTVQWPDDFDFAMRFDGGLGSGIESASIGEIKASFK